MVDMMALWSQAIAPIERVGMKPREFATVAGLVVALAILGAIAITTYRSTRQALDDYRWVAHTYQVLEKLRDLQAAVMQAQAQPTTLDHLPALIQDLRQLTRDNPRQQQRLDALAPMMQPPVQGHVAMDAIRTSIATMEQEEQALLAQRLARNEQSQQLAMVIIIVGNIAAFVSLALAITVISRESTRRLRAERDAIADRHKLDLILSSVSEGVVAADAQGHFTLFNPAAETLIGIGATSVPTAEWAEHYGVFHPDRVTPYPADQVPLVRTLRGESCQNVEIFMRNPKKPEGVAVSVSGRPVLSERGDVVGGVVVVSDITERKRFEDEISRKNDELAHAYADLDRTRLQQLETKDQLLSHVSHELRTPLTAAYQFVEILRDGVAGDLSQEQQEYTDIALRNLKQLRAMIGDLLDATRVESAKLTIEPTRMNLADIAKDVCRTLYSPAAEKGIVIDNRIGSIPDVLADPDRVRQVFTNLLHNAIKFTRDGRITLDASLADDDPSYVRVSVADTGCGMSSEDANRIFNRLYQAGDRGIDSRQGLGLGLYICKELITRQGGRIWTESELGKGSTFHCTFRVCQPAAALAEAHT